MYSRSLYQYPQLLYVSKILEYANSLPAELERTVRIDYYDTLALITSILNWYILLVKPANIIWYHIANRKWAKFVFSKSVFHKWRIYI